MSAPEPGAATLHATTVAIGGRGVMLVGPPGVGKSDLALRLIDRGAALVSDDYTMLNPDGDRVLASPPRTIAGRIEVRGIGIVATPFVTSIPVELVVVLGDETDRLPEPRWRTIAGCMVREIVIDPRASSAPIKVEWALRHLLDDRPQERWA